MRVDGEPFAVKMEIVDSQHTDLQGTTGRDRALVPFSGLMKYYELQSKSPSFGGIFH